MANEIWRGTTPTIHLSIPCREEDIATGYVTFSQDGAVIVEKDKDDFDFSKEGYITIELSQEDTLAFKASRTLEVQVRMRMHTGKAIESTIKTAVVRRALKNGVI